MRLPMYSGARSLEKVWLGGLVISYFGAAFVGCRGRYENTMAFRRLIPVGLLAVLTCLAFCDHAGAATVQEEPSYVLQPNDEITLHSLQMKEIADKVYRLDE